MQRIPPIRPIMRRSYLNLDSIFGHIFSNLSGEPLSPTRIATFYLLRILFEAHFGKKHIKSPFPFTTEEKSRVFQHLYSLMTLEEEVPYFIFRMIVRMAFGESRSITRHFYMAMEQLGRGYADVNLYVEDEFYTNRHLKDPNPNLSFYERLILNERKIMPFSSSHSFMYRWMKRLMAEHTKTTPSDMFEVNIAMRQWIMNDDTLVMPGLPEKILPYFIDCSMRARGWVAQNLYFIQKCPRFAFTYANMLHFAQLVQKRHKDVYEAYLLEATVRVQQKDCPNAVKALKTFFDYTMLDLNENMTHCARTFRLAVPNTVPLLYAPLLNGRLCRMFGDYEMARQLLQESLQQAQLHNEEICHQLANLELLIIEIIGCEPLLEDRVEKLPSFIEEDRRVQRKALRGIEDMYCFPLPGMPCCSQTEDEFELCCEMDSLGKLLMMLKMCARGTFKLRTGQLAETGLLCPTMNDYEERGKRIEAYGQAIMTSNMIRNGMFKQAQATAGEMLVNNFHGPGGQEYFETETWAVGAVNLAYSFAGQGNYVKALETIDHMEWSFPEELSWQSFRHVTICKAVVKFERHLLKNKYKKCEKAICALISHSEIEFKLRRALLLAVTGRKMEAIDLLGKIDTLDIYGKIRIHLQMTTIFASMKQYEKAEAELAEAVKAAKNTTFRNMPYMINRRAAVLLMIRERYSQACDVLNDCASDIINYGSFVEKACFYITLAQCLRLLKKDPRVWLKQARALVRGGQWPAMEKLVIAELAMLHEANGMFPDSDRLYQMREQFGKLATTHKGQCDWMLF